MSKKEEGCHDSFLCARVRCVRWTGLELECSSAVHAPDHHPMCVGLSVNRSTQRYMASEVSAQAVLSMASKRPRACECVLNLTFPEVPPTTPADCHSEMAGPLNGRTGGSAVLRSIPMSVLDKF